MRTCGPGVGSIQSMWVKAVLESQAVERFDPIRLTTYICSNAHATNVIHAEYIGYFRLLSSVLSSLCLARMCVLCSKIFLLLRTSRVCEKSPVSRNTAPLNPPLKRLTGVGVFAPKPIEPGCLLETTRTQAKIVASDTVVRPIKTQQLPFVHVMSPTQT